MIMELWDRFKRKIEYVRFSLTDRCNLRCTYCLPSMKIQWYEREEILTFEEILTLIHFFKTRFSMKKFRFTGGEPLLRRGVEVLFERVRHIGPELDLNITTNALFLKEKAKYLQQFRIKTNVSLDTLSSETFYRLTGSTHLSSVLEGIDEALRLEIPLKINTVALRGINDREFIDLVEFARARNVPIRFIEYMPVSSNKQFHERFISEREILETLRQRYDLDLVRKESIATVYRIRNGGGEIGFISTVSSPFCHACNRLRITAAGDVVLCLFDRKGYSLKPFLRPEFREDDLIQFLMTTIQLKPPGFISHETREYVVRKQEGHSYAMIKLGG